MKLKLPFLAALVVVIVCVLIILVNIIVSNRIKTACLIDRNESSSWTVEDSGGKMGFGTVPWLIMETNRSDYEKWLELVRPRGVGNQHIPPSVSSSIRSILGQRGTRIDLKQFSGNDGEMVYFVELNSDSKIKVAFFVFAL